MANESTRLIVPDPALAATYQSLIDESLACGEEFYPRLFAFLGLDTTDAAGAVPKLLALEDIPGDSRLVPTSTRWLVDEQGCLLGECRLRHRLSERLLHHGGHIGYFVRPSARRQGHATRMLALMLDEARRLGLCRVLLTCDKSNTGSASVIRANGGVLEDEPVSRFSHQVIQRYWIAL